MGRRLLGFAVAFVALLAHEKSNPQIGHPSQWDETLKE
jgi:hypothetical protein